MLEHLPDLIRTDVELARILGTVEAPGDCLVVRTPHNPDFYFGNYLLLPGPPEDLDTWCTRFEAEFGPTTRHRTFVWHGAAASSAVTARALALGFSSNLETSLAMDQPPEAPRDHDLTIRPLDPETEFARIEALDRASDPSEATGTVAYQQFKARFRETIRQWMDQGRATWWGAFESGRMVGQCGFAKLGDLGRFQAVITHPAERRRGICSALIATVARHGFEVLGCRRVLLQADTIGPAVGLYRRLGFEEDESERSLVLPGDPVQVLPEDLAHHPDVRSLTIAAFGGPTEAERVCQLRAQQGLISRVAIRAGSVLGHIALVPISATAVELAVLAIRPDSQGRGVGTQLVEVGLDACRAAGHQTCCVSSPSAFFVRFGFESAESAGPGGRQQVLDL